MKYKKSMSLYDPESADLNKPIKKRKAYACHYNNGVWINIINVYNYTKFISP